MTYGTNCKEQVIDVAKYLGVRIGSNGARVASWVFPSLMGRHEANNVVGYS